MYKTVIYRFRGRLHDIGAKSEFTPVPSLWCGRTVSRAGGRAVYGHVITKFSRMGRLLYFLTHGAPLARFARESSAKNYVLFT